MGIWMETHYINLQGDDLERVYTFQYLGVALA